MKVLLVTFSDNAGHQDICFGMFESLYKANQPGCEAWVMGINTPKISVMDTLYMHLVDWPKKPGIEKKAFDWKELNYIISWINKQHFNVIFFETLYVWTFAFMMRCHKKSKIFQMIHVPILHEGDKQTKGVHMMNKDVRKTADYIVLTNQKYVPKVTEIYGVGPKHVRYVDMWRRFLEYTKPRFTKYASFFDRMNPNKGVGIVKLRPNVQFHTVGRVDPLVQWQVAQLKAQPNIMMNNGYVTNDKMAGAFINADWIIPPYNSDTQSGVVIDGYRYGRPCIAFNVVAITEQVREGVTGFLIESGNNEVLIKKLLEAVQMNEQSYSKLSKSAYDYDSRKYFADGAIKRFVSLITNRGRYCYIAICFIPSIEYQALANRNLPFNCYLEAA